MTKTGHPPSISETAFDCPHCGAYTTQYWHRLYARNFPDNRVHSFLDADEVRERIEQQERIGQQVGQQGWTTETKINFINAHTRRGKGEIFISNKEESKYAAPIHNIYLSKCFNCEQIAIWTHKTLVHPVAALFGPESNADMPPDVRKDFEEARKVVKESPRSACALLRLAVQKLCVDLGQPGKDLNGDIAALVATGLPDRVQKSLDIVRVIGNQAVHPGEYNLKDDAGTAVQLFSLVNIIVEQMITLPKTLNDMYSTLPAGKRKAIERRDAAGVSSNGSGSDEASDASGD